MVLSVVVGLGLMTFGAVEGSVTCAVGDLEFDPGRPGFPVFLVGCALLAGTPGVITWLRRTWPWALLTAFGTAVAASAIADWPYAGFCF